ncbi:hypothetical protein ACOMHN_004892 [Nucella lapillus]
MTALLLLPGTGLAPPNAADPKSAAVRERGGDRTKCRDGKRYRALLAPRWRTLRSALVRIRCQPDMDSQGPKCITEVAFELVCLNPFVMKTAYLQFRQEHDVDLDTTQAE